MGQIVLIVKEISASSITGKASLPKKREGSVLL